MTLAGVAATLVVSLLFILTGSKFTKALSYMLFGFGILIAYGDLDSLSISKNIIALFAFLSWIVIIIAIVRISFYYIQEQNIFKKVIEKDGGQSASSKS